MPPGRHAFSLPDQALLIESISLHAPVSLLIEQVPASPIWVDDVLAPASPHGRRTANEDSRVFIDSNLKVPQVVDLRAGIA